jgi:long-chain acyl-CoA synthetase
VSPQVVEDVLLSVPEIAEAAAFGVPDAMGVMRIWAAMVTRGPVDASALHAMCVRRLGPKAPRFVLRMDALPRNEAGKLRRHELTMFALERYPEHAKGT